jgi:hypothetical protein
MYSCIGKMLSAGTTHACVLPCYLTPLLILVTVRHPRCLWYIVRQHVAVITGIFCSRALENEVYSDVSDQWCYSTHLLL